MRFGSFRFFALTRRIFLMRLKEAKFYLRNESPEIYFMVLFILHDLPLDMIHLRYVKKLTRFIEIFSASITPIIPVLSHDFPDI